MQFLYDIGYIFFKTSFTLKLRANQSHYHKSTSCVTNLKFEFDISKNNNNKKLFSKILFGRNTKHFHLMKFLSH